MLWHTNVISELARPKPNPNVLDFAASQTDIKLSVVTLDELYFGLAWKPHPRIRLWLDDFVRDYCEVLAISPDIARFAADLRGNMQAQGEPRTQADMLMAATAVMHHLPLVTRNVADFAGCGVKLANPFGHPFGQ